MAKTSAIMTVRKKFRNNLVYRALNKIYFSRKVSLFVVRPFCIRKSPEHGNTPGKNVAMHVDLCIFIIARIPEGRKHVESEIKIR